MKWLRSVYSLIRLLVFSVHFSRAALWMRILNYSWVRKLTICRSYVVVTVVVLVLFSYFFCSRLFLIDDKNRNKAFLSSIFHLQVLFYCLFAFLFFGFPHLHTYTLFEKVIIKIIFIFRFYVVIFWLDTKGIITNCTLITFLITAALL